MARNLLPTPALLLPLLLAGCAGPSLPAPHVRLEVSGEVTLAEAQALDFGQGHRELRLSFQLPTSDYEKGYARLVDPTFMTPEGPVEATGSGAFQGSGSPTLLSDVQVQRGLEVTSFTSRVEVLLLGAQNQVVVENWDALVGQVVELPELPGQLEVLSWTPEEARFRVRVPFPERVEQRVSDEHVAKSVVYRPTLVDDHTGEWHLRFDVPCPKGTSLRLSYTPQAQRYTGRVEVSPLEFRDGRAQ